MSQPPANYGWFIPPTDQTPYAPPAPQDPSYQPSSYIVPPGNNVQPFGGIGFDFGPFPADEAPPAPFVPSAPPPYQEPSCPLSGPALDDPSHTRSRTPTAPGTDLSQYDLSGPGLDNSSEGMASAPPEELLALEEATGLVARGKASNTPKRTPSKRDSALHQTDDRYKEGLRDMADLMTDVDLNDEVLRAVKNRFNLNK